MLKLTADEIRAELGKPAAFGRLCVETCLFGRAVQVDYPAAFGRLCVETIMKLPVNLYLSQPPSGGCVLKLTGFNCIGLVPVQPPSGGCVLKPAAVWSRFSGRPSRLRAAVC